MNQWKNIIIGDQVHVLPMDDLKEHQESENCWCNPRRDEEELKLIIHNSVDQREKYETGERKPN